MLIIGIDNGLKGGIVVIDNNQKIIKKYIMPIIQGERNVYDISEIVKIFNEIKYLCEFKKVNCIAILEKAHARFVSGKAQCFSTGYCYGVIQGILSSFNIPYKIVSPQQWQKYILKDTNGDTKQQSILYVTKLYPNENWKESDRCKKYHDGLTDACCLALYGLHCGSDNNEN
jgi:Holliday junction resolvasome RuvABC endonuclease subunit